MSFGEASPESFLRLIQRSRRGRLKVYLGYGPGVGKSYQMLLEGHRLLDRGVDVVVGYAENHGRADTESLLLGLPVVPRRRIVYRGLTLEEMDLDAVLARRPAVALVDELAHTNVPGSRHAKRYQDVLALLDAGVNVITTVNVQHLESLYDTVERLVGVKVKERLPDWVVAEADQVVNVDLAVEDLQQRLREGKVYPYERVAAALDNFFTPTHLAQLRELTLREAASQVQRGRRPGLERETLFAPDQIMVCLSSQGPDAAALLRYGSRLAGRLDRTWYAVYVQTPAEEPTRVDAATQRQVSATLGLAHELGATAFTFRGDDVAATILAFAREYGVGHIVVGRPGPRRGWRRLCRRASPVAELLARAGGYTVVVVDPRGEPPAGAVPRPEAEPATPPLPAAPPAAAGVAVADLLDPRAVLVLAETPAKEELLARLVARLGEVHPQLDADMALRRLLRREGEGSTFLEGGIGLPHARLPGLAAPLLALATSPGDGASPALPRVTLLLLCPEEQPSLCLELMAQLARIVQRGALQAALGSAPDAAAVARIWRRRAGYRPAAGSKEDP
jgi:two-component system, OmpR family, sensor histidine kinase KdpD